MYFIQFQLKKSNGIEKNVLTAPTKTGSCPYIFLHSGGWWCCGLMDPDRSGRHPSGVYVCVCVPSGSAIRGYCRVPFQSESNQIAEHIRGGTCSLLFLPVAFTCCVCVEFRVGDWTLCFRASSLCVGVSATLTEAKLCTPFSLTKRGFRITCGF